MDFDFSRLPDNVFVNILLHLPWRQRVTCRRVNSRWMEIGNSALAVSTKVIDNFSSFDFSGMGNDGLFHLLPIVADGLEKLQLHWGTSESFDFRCVGTIPLFRALKEIDFGSCPVKYEEFFSILDKAPKLEKLTANVPKKPTDSTYTPKSYENIKNLHVSSEMDGSEITDPYLMMIAEHFPNVSQLSISNYAFLTASCLNSFVGCYGDKFAQLEIEFCQELYGERHQRVGDFTGIGICRNLTYLSMTGTSFITDAFMAALATGCINLETLDLSGGVVGGEWQASNAGLALLASLPKLTKLNLNNIGSGFGAGISAIAQGGHLKEVLLQGLELPAQCLKTCVRHCPQLKLLDVAVIGTEELTVDDAEEIAIMFAQYGQQPRLIIRVDGGIWLDQRIREIQNTIKEGDLGHRSRFVIDCRTDNRDFLSDDDDDDGNTMVYEDEVQSDFDFSGYGFDADYDPGDDDFEYDSGSDFVSS